MRIIAAFGAWLLAVFPAFAVEYRVSVDWPAGSLQIDVCAERAIDSLRLFAQPHAHRYLRDYWRDDRQPIRLRGEELWTGPLAADTCLHYRVDAAKASAERGSRFTRAHNPRVWLLSPGLWLWRSEEASIVQLDLPPGMQASVPWIPIDGQVRRYRLAAGGGDWPAWSAFGAIDERQVRAADGSSLRIALVDPESPQRAELLHHWLREVAVSATTAFGRFPIPDAQILVLSIDAVSDSPVPWGQTTRGGAPAVQLFVRKDATFAELRADWTAIHEFSHLFHPYLGERGRWLAEGLASYYQNILRARAGLISETDAWQRLDAGFARGRASHSGQSLAALSDAGRYAGIMRIYWGGAAFWLQADLALHAARGFGIDTVLDRYALCCPARDGSIEPMDFLSKLDALAGIDVLVPLAQSYLAMPNFPDLQDTYRTLGLQVTAAGATLASDPSTTRLRRAIMGPRGAPLTTAGDD